MTRPAIRPARGADAPAIVGLIRAAFDPGLVGITTYGCEGAALYVAEQIGASRESVETGSSYSVADADGPLAGCIELRRHPDALFLNYVAVAREHRRAGLGSRLLAAAIEGSRSPARRTLRLDVFDSSAPALRWYKKLGLEEEGRTPIWSLGLPPIATHANAWRLPDWEKAEERHGRYCFSVFRMAAAGRQWTVGRLGDRWFRVTEPGLLSDAAALLALRDLDPDRRLLAFAPEEAIPDGFFVAPERVAVSVRMAGSLETVLSRLG